MPQGNERFNMAIVRRLSQANSKIPGLVSEKDGPRVLYVEDNEMNFDIARSILDTQFKIDWAASSDQAIDKLGVGNYDLVLMDIELSGSALSGIDLTQEIRSGRFDSEERRLSELPIIIVTAYTAAYSEAELLGLGANAMLYKPMEPQLLVERAQDLSLAT